jgi:ribosomal-protein-serine acetyltransferase
LTRDALPPIDWPTDVCLTGDGICIRPFESSDIEAFVQATHESIATVGIWMPWCQVSYSASDACAWFIQCAENLRTAYAYDLGIFSEDGVVLYGGIAINQINRKHNFGTIGYWVRQSCQRRGIASRAIKLISAFGFEQLKLTRLEIIVAEANAPSRGVAEKIGATFECVARNRLVIGGPAISAAVYSLTP